MRIAFYAPLKPPRHPIASGDRTMARLLMTALARRGHIVATAATLRARDPAGDPALQERIRGIGTRLAEHLVRRWQASPERAPHLWFTYHLYYKAPDWLGPRVADALGIPYVVAEASLAGKRDGGPWRLGHAATRAALHRADAVIGLNSSDREGVLPALAAPARWHALPPFIDTAPFAAARQDRAATRAALAAQYAIDPGVPWLVAVAMMRPGDKAQSYAILAAALAGLTALPWRLLIIGEGAARAAIAAAFAGCAERVAFLGHRDGAALAAALAACNLCVWPAVNEAYGMALLEAQAAGLPVLAGAAGGVPDIVADGITGRLTPPGDVAAFAGALAALIAAPKELQRLGRAAAEQAAALHDIEAASRRLDAILRGVGDGSVR